MKTKVAAAFLSTLGLAVSLTACGSDGAECTAANHCFRNAEGHAECEEGYTWANHDSDNDYTCVPVDPASLCATPKLQAAAQVCCPPYGTEACTDGLVCFKGTDALQPVCVDPTATCTVAKLQGVSQPCCTAFGAEACVEGSACTLASGATTPVCITAPPPCTYPEGQALSQPCCTSHGAAACAGQAACTLQQGASEPVCVSTAPCEYPLTQGLSEPCCTSHGIDACGAGLFCAAFDGRTQATCYAERSRLDMAECTADLQCVSGSCNTTEKKCRSLPGATCTLQVGCGNDPAGNRYGCDPVVTPHVCKILSGQANALCEGQADCDGDLTCDQNRCHKLLGEACYSDECGAGAGCVTCSYSDVVCQNDNHSRECALRCAEMWALSCYPVGQSCNTGSSYDRCALGSQCRACSWSETHCANDSHEGECLIECNDGSWRTSCS